MSKAIAINNKDLDDSMVLGYLFFYSMGDLSIRPDDLRDLFIKHGLDPNIIRPISPVDAFRRSSSKVKQTVMIEFNGDKRKAKIEVDEVLSNTDEVIRAVGRKVVDSKNQDLSYETLGKVIFDRKTESVHKQYTPGFCSEEYNYDDIFNEIDLNYNMWSTYHTKDAVRNVIGHVLNAMFPVNLMPSGMCKFVPSDHKDMLYSLQGVVKDLTSYGDPCFFETVPVIDTKEMRNTIKNASQNEMEQEALTLMTELKTVLTSGSTLSTRAVTSYIQKTKDLANKVTNYESLLGTYMGYLRRQINEVYTIATTDKTA